MLLVIVQHYNFFHTSINGPEMKFRNVLPAAALFLFANVASALPFVNGGFEDGNTNGWVTGGGSRDSIPNSAISPADFLPGGSLYDSTANRSTINTVGT